MRKHGIVFLAATSLTSTAMAGDDWSIDWYTIDSGGMKFSAGGDFELTGGFGGLTLEELADLLFSDRFESKQ